MGGGGQAEPTGRGGRTGQSQSSTPEGSQEQQPWHVLMQRLLALILGQSGAVSGGQDMEKGTTAHEDMSEEEETRHRRRQQRQQPPPPPPPPPMTTWQKVMRVVPLITGPSLTIAGLVPLILTETQIASLQSVTNSSISTSISTGTSTSTSTTVSASATQSADFKELGVACLVKSAELDSVPVPGQDDICTNELT